MGTIDPQEHANHEPPSNCAQIGIIGWNTNILLNETMIQKVDVELVRTIFDISKELNDFDHSNYKGIVLGFRIAQCLI